MLRCLFTCIFEFTAPGTPQQNSMVERKIPTLMGRSRAMMLTAGFSRNVRLNREYTLDVQPKGDRVNSRVNCVNWFWKSIW